MQRSMAIIALVLLWAVRAHAADSTADVSSRLPSIALPASARLDKVRFVVMYRTTSEVSALGEFFNAKMVEAGWEGTADTPVTDETDSPQLNFAKGDFTASIVISPARVWRNVMIGISKDESHPTASTSTAVVSQHLPAVALPPNMRLDKIRCMLFYRSASGIEPLAKFFTKKLRTNGWVMEEEYPNKTKEGATEIAADKKGFTGSVILTADGDGTQMFVSIARTEPRSIMERSD